MQRQVTSSFKANQTSKYPTSHSQQKAITKSVVEDLIVQCGLPLSIVEHPNFRHFFSVVGSSYTLPARTTITNCLTKEAEKVQKCIVDKLSTVKSISMTLDIWSDRRMRAYLGITGHYIEFGQLQLSSSLLSCSRFRGSHTGERIAAEVVSVMDAYQIQQKVDFFITDNAANMRKALTTFVTQDDEQIDEEANELAVENPELWQDLDPVDHAEIDEVLAAHSKRERLSCFDHSLHLVVGDDLKNTKCISTALSKCCKICSLLHTSALFSDAFAQVFGPNKGIPASVVTRWNSTLRQVKALLSLDAKQLQDLLEMQGHNHLVLSAREWSQLNELVDLLDPFLEATLLTESDVVVTITFCLPSVLALINHLCNSRRNVKYCGTIADALLASINQKFDGMLQRVQVARAHRFAGINSMPFGSDIYIIATFFDPKFRLKWIDNEMELPDDQKEDLKNALTGAIFKNLFFYLLHS